MCTCLGDTTPFFDFIFIIFVYGFFQTVRSRYTKPLDVARGLVDSRISLLLLLTNERRTTAADTPTDTDDPGKLSGRGITKCKTKKYIKNSLLARHECIIRYLLLLSNKNCEVFSVILLLQTSWLTATMFNAFSILIREHDYINPEPAGKPD